MDFIGFPFRDLPETRGYGDEKLWFIIIASTGITIFFLDFVGVCLPYFWTHPCPPVDSEPGLGGTVTTVGASKGAGQSTRGTEIPG